MMIKNYVTVLIVILSLTLPTSLYANEAEKKESKGSGFFSFGWFSNDKEPEEKKAETPKEVKKETKKEVVKEPQKTPEKKVEKKPEQKSKPTPPKPKLTSKEEFCDMVNKKFLDYGWTSIVCNPSRWKVRGHTKKGLPLLYQEFGDIKNDKLPMNLFLCGTHGDENTGVYLCFHLVRELLYDNKDGLKNFRIAIAPIVNPEGFFAETRTNSSGIDPNRNLPTKDFVKRAQKVWKRYKNDPRKNPGKIPGSEPESKFQVFLIDQYKPDKIVSVHAPYGFLDFDGPGDRKYYNLVRVEQRAKFLALNMEANSKKFLRVVDFRFFPGSLGNYAGNERKIPTYTLELPSVDVKKAPFYWSRLKFALVKAMAFRVYDGKEGNPFLKVKHLVSKDPPVEKGSKEAKTDIPKTQGVMPKTQKQ